MSNAFNFRMPTHIAPLADGVEVANFELAVETAYETLLEALAVPMSDYVGRRAVGTSDDEYNDCVVKLQMKYLRMVLAKVNIEHLES